MQQQLQAMKQSQKFKRRLTHNIIWKKWEKRKDLNNQQNQINNKSMKKMKAFQLMDYEEKEPSQLNSQSVKAKRKSFQEFINGIGTMKQNLNWVKVGQLNNYCITYARPQNKILKTQNPQPLAFSRNTLRKRSVNSRASVPSWRHLKTEPIPELRQKINIRPKYPTISSQQLRVQTKQKFSHPISIKKRKTSFQYRPWSGVSKQQLIQHNFHQRTNY